MSQDQDIDIFGNINSFLENGLGNSSVAAGDDTLGTLDSDTSFNDSPSFLSPISSFNIATGKTQSKSRATRSSRKLNQNHTIELLDDDDLDLTDAPKNITAGKGQTTALKRFEKLREKLETEVNFSAGFTTSPPKRQTNVTQSVARKKLKSTPQVRLGNHFNSNVSSTVTDDEHEHKVNPNNISLDEEDDNYKMSIKIRWLNRVERHSLKKHQKFLDLIERLAVNEKVNKECIILNLDEKIIIDTDTPASIGYTLGKFISGRIVKDQNELQFVKKQTTNIGKNDIELKIQMADRRKPFIKKMQKTSQFKELLVQCAAELGCSPNILKLRFDGELIDINETPNDLDMDGGEMLELKKN